MACAELVEEIEVINSIYEDCCEFNEQTSSISLQFPGTEVRAKLFVPQQYPNEPPRISDVTGVDPKFNAIERLQTIIDNTFMEGEVYLYTFLDECEQEVATLAEMSSHKDELPAVIESKGSNFISKWSLTGEIKDRGSTFIGRAVKASSEEEVSMLLADLLDDKKVSRANHKMAAWRVKLENEGYAQDFDDDGEAGAGGCILHILQMANVENVLVVVCRYFGGVHIGPDRFKHIKSSTRDALIAGQFI